MKTENKPTMLEKRITGKTRASGLGAFLYKKKVPTTLRIRRGKNFKTYTMILKNRKFRAVDERTICQYMVCK